MQLAQSEVLGIVDYDGVDIGHVNARFDDSGGYKDVIVVVGEVDDGLFECFGGHLPVRNYGARIRNKSAYHVLQAVQSLDTIIDDENLTAARKLETYGLGQQVIAESVHIGDYGVTIGRRSGQRRKVARAHEREL